MVKGVSVAIAILLGWYSGFWVASRVLGLQLLLSGVGIGLWDYVSYKETEILGGSNGRCCNLRKGDRMAGLN